MPVNALSMGCVLYLCIRMTSGISGGALNPAVGLVQSMYQKTINAHKYPDAPGTSLVYVPAYIFGPFFGAFLASLFQKLMHEKALAYSDEVAEEEYGYEEDKEEIK